jgi:hypothetical protein
MRRLTVTLAIVAIVAVMAAPSGGAAAAGDQRSSELVLQDGTGDVWTAPVGGDSYAPAAGNVADVLRVRLVHGRRAIRARWTLADLTRPGRQRFDLAIRTDSGTWHAEAATSRRTPGGRHHLWEQGGDRVSCPAMFHRLGYRTDTVLVVIPTTCLGEPDWVRFVVSNLHESRTRLAKDNPHNDRPFPGGPTGRLYAR